MLKTWGMRLLAAAAAALLLSMSAAASVTKVEEEPMYTSFTYAVSRGSIYALESPAPYRVAGQVDAVSLGTPLGTPSDLCVYNNEVYIADSANHCVLRTDAAFNLLDTIRGFTWKGKQETFSKPEGISVTADHVYVADTGNHRIVVLNRDGSCASIIEKPNADILSNDLVFEPRKITADGKGRVYAVVKGVYEGIMELYEDGNFGGFVGSIPVDPDPITLLWKSLMSKEQREKLENFIPVEYTNLTLDADGFLFTVSLAADDQDSIRRLNAAGNDILVRTSLGNIPVSGAVEEAKGFPVDGELSDFVDIAVGEDNLYYALDAEYGRIYAYDDNGNLLYVFGGRSTGQNGTFPKGSSIALLGEKVLVADSSTGTITLFTRTAYAEAIAKGIAQYNDDSYAESIDTWNEVLQYNRHFVLAYSKIGQALYQTGNYAEAMEYFERAVDQTNYSKAFERWRNTWFTDHFVGIVIGVIAVIGVLMVARLALRRILQRYPVKAGGVLDSLHYPLYVIFHPFDGFWDLKYENRGRKWVATLLVALTVVTFAVERSLSGFAVSAVPDRQLDILYELKFVMVPLLLFLVGNLSITTLMDGKGTLGQIYTAVGYTLTPLILIKLPLTLVSNLLTQNELMYVQLLNVIAIVWVAFLLFGALLSTHEYTGSKTVATLIITVVAMLIICFICVLFFSLFSELVGFVYTMFQEMRYR